MEREREKKRLNRGPYGIEIMIDENQMNRCTHNILQWACSVHSNQ